MAPRPLYGHASSSQPAYRCSIGQLHSIAGAASRAQQLDSRAASSSLDQLHQASMRASCHTAGTESAPVEQLRSFAGAWASTRFAASRALCHTAGTIGLLPVP